MDVLTADGRDRHTDVVMATLSRFVEHEEMESRSVADRLLAELRSQNLAVVGSAPCLDALLREEVDTLVLASDYQPDPGWTCVDCGAIGTETPETTVCPQCGESSVRPLDVKEALLRLAVQADCPVEVVEQSDALTSLGGIGCLLRLRPELGNGTGNARTEVETTQADTSGKFHAAQTMKLARA